jgi:hypothetical protein
MIMNREYVRILNEALVACFKILYWHIEIMRKTNKTLIHRVRRLLYHCGDPNSIPRDFTRGLWRGGMALEQGFLRVLRFFPC